MKNMQAGELSALFQAKTVFLMEGGLGERLKAEYGLAIDGPVAMASLVRQEAGRRALAALWREYLAMAQQAGLPFLATTPTRRANKERMVAAGYGEELLEENVAFLKEVLKGSTVPAFAGALMGCKGDAYTGEGALTEEEAYEFHFWAAQGFFHAGAAFLYAGILPTLPEAKGMARAMAQTGLPYFLSFTIVPEGTLVDGTPIAEAIRAIDALPGPKPLGYFSNCVHPQVVAMAYRAPCNRGRQEMKRFVGVQANATLARLSDLEGENRPAPTDPKKWAQQMAELFGTFQVFGGCCGTDGTYMRELAMRLSAKRQKQQQSSES